MNAGDGDLVIGDRADPANPYAPYFEFSPCHGHYHIKDFSVYQLLRLDGTVAAEGHKQGFCLTDSFKYGENKSNGYDCHFQGITSGWGDWSIQSSWLGNRSTSPVCRKATTSYRVVINFSGIFDEGENRYPNVIRAEIHVPDPRKKVTIQP